MEKRSIDDWLPPIDLLTKTVEKVIFFIQGSNVSLQKRQDQVLQTCSQTMTLEEAISKRKEELKYYKKLLSNCQNTLKTKLQISQAGIFKEMDDIDAQIMSTDQTIHLLDEQAGLKECIHNINSQITKYNQKLSLINNEIHKVKSQLKSQAKIDSQYQSYLSAIQQLKEKKRKVMHKRRQIASQKSEIDQSDVIKVPAYKQNLKMKNALKSSISKLRLQIANYDQEIVDTERQKNKMQTLIRDTQDQFINIKQFTNDTISKTTQKTYFITNVVDEIKKLIKIRREFSDLKKKIHIENQHYFDFQSEIRRVNSKIQDLKMEKKKLINEECAIEDNFLKKAIPKKKTKNKRKNFNNIIILNNNNNDDYSNDDSITNEHELIINQKKDIKDMEKNNLKLLKSLESENQKIISLRQKIRELQENIVFQVKLKKEKESLRKERENHSIFFSFEKIQNQIDEKKMNIEKLKQKIKEEKEFLRLYSKIENDLNDSDF